MSDLISRSESIEELEKYEKELQKDKVEAIETDDENMLFAITNQLTAICRIKRNIMNMPTAYDIAKVVEELKTDSSVKLYGSQNSDNYMIPVNRAIEIVKQGGAAVANNATTKNDVCEYKITDNMVHAGCNNKQIASAFCWFNECDDYKYCPHCGKKIKVVE